MSISDENLSFIIVVGLKLFTFLSFSPEPLSKIQPWVMENQLFTNEGPHPISKGYNSEILKMHSQISEIFSRKTGPNSTKHSTKHPLVIGN